MLVYRVELEVLLYQKKEKVAIADDPFLVVVC